MEAGEKQIIIETDRRRNLPMQIERYDDKLNEGIKIRKKGKSR